MLDRQLQLQMLRDMAAVYPRPAESLAELAPDDPQLLANVMYLHEHNLADATMHEAIGLYQFGWAKITARGLDFLADDGGLSAILGVVTVRFEADTLRALLLDRVESDPAMPEAEKSWWRQQLKSLSEQGLKAAISEAAKQGLQRMPDAMQWLRGFLPGL